MERRDGGYWELFCPGVTEGAIYKYRIQRGDLWAEKSDRSASARLPPRTASVAGTRKASYGAIRRGWKSARA